MTEVAIATDAPTQPAGTAIDPNTVIIPNPIEHQAVTPDPADKADKRSEAAKSSPHDALAKANETLKARDANDAPTADKEARKAAERHANADDGEKVAKGRRDDNAEPRGDHREPPARFSQDARTEWAKVPEAVQHETHRALSELERGYHIHRQAADSWREIEDFSEIARKGGTTLRAALGNYVGIERLLRRDPIAGFHQIARNTGLPVKAIAERILSEAPTDEERRQIPPRAALPQAPADQRQESEAMGRLHTAVDAFATAAEYFDALAPAIVEELRRGSDSDLSPMERLRVAYQRAKQEKERLSAGRKSIGGAPGRGVDASTEAGKGKVPSIHEALKNASARAARW